MSSGHGRTTTPPLQPGELLLDEGAEEGHRRIRDSSRLRQTACRAGQRSDAYYASGEGECGEVAAPGGEDRPENVAARLNLGMLLGRWEGEGGGKGVPGGGEGRSESAQAAYNLCVVTSKDRMDEALTWCRKATNLRPEEPRYGYTYAFLLDRRDTAKAVPSAEDRGPSQPFSPPTSCSYDLRETGKAGEQRSLQKAADNAELPEPDRAQFRNRLQSMGDSARGAYASPRNLERSTGSSTWRVLLAWRHLLRPFPCLL